MIARCQCLYVTYGLAFAYNGFSKYDIFSLSLNITTWNNTSYLISGSCTSQLLPPPPWPPGHSGDIVFCNEQTSDNPLPRGAKFPIILPTNNTDLSTVLCVKNNALHFSCPFPLQSVLITPHCRVKKSKKAPPFAPAFPPQSQGVRGGGQQLTSA